MNPGWCPVCSVLPSTSEWLVPRGTGDSGPEEAPFPGWQSPHRVFAARAPGFSQLVPLPQGVMILTCFRL